MAGDDTQTSTQTQNRDIWGPAASAGAGVLNYAGDLWGRGIGSTANPMSMVTPYSGQTMRGVQGLEELARRNEGTGSLGAQYQQVIDRGGYTPTMEGALSDMRGISRAASGPSYSERNLAGVASGDYLNRQDPNFERALAAASESAANQVNLGASAMGRYGGAIHQGNVAREVGNYEAAQRVNQYNQERQRQVEANNLIDATKATNANIGMNANNAIYGMGRDAFNNLGVAYQSAQAPYLDMMKVGGYGEDLYTRQLNDMSRQFTEAQTAPWAGLGNLSNLALGYGSAFGPTYSTAEQPGQSKLASGLGMASTGVGILGGLKGLGWF